MLKKFLLLSLVCSSFAFTQVFAESGKIAVVDMAQLINKSSQISTPYKIILISPNIIANIKLIYKNACNVSGSNEINWLITWKNCVIEFHIVFKKSKGAVNISENVNFSLAPSA